MKINQLKKSLFTIKLRFIKGDSSTKTSIAPTLSQYGLNLREFNNLFDVRSYFIEDYFEVGCNFNVFQNKIINFRLKEPSSSFFIKNFGLHKGFSSDIKYKDLLKYLYEIAVVKSNKYNMTFMNLYTICKIHKSILFSFEKYRYFRNK